jgi:hypothetical protein
MVGKRTVRDRMIVRGVAIGQGSKVTRMEHKFRGHVVWKLIEVQQEEEEEKNMRTYIAIAAAAAMITSAAIAQPANRDANTPAVNTPNSAQSGRAGLRSNQLHRRTGEVAHRVERLCQRERAAQRRSGRLAWEGNEGRQERRG